jgi:hypothetical protein
MIFKRWITRLKEGRGRRRRKLGPYYVMGERSEFSRGLVNVNGDGLNGKRREKARMKIQISLL